MELIKTIKTCILKYLKKKFSEPITEELLDTASFVDPKFKTVYITSTIQEEVKTDDGVNSCCPQGKYPREHKAVYVIIRSKETKEVIRKFFQRK